MNPLSALASSRLDAMRGLAALAVFVGHGRSLFFADFGQVAGPNPLTKLLYAATGFGHQAVMVFFVMSGFLITRSIVGALKQGRWTWQDYALSRLVRLWIVLIPAIALGAAFDRAGAALFGLEGAYGGGGYAFVIQQAVPDVWGFGTALGNIAFLQMIWVPTFGSNGPLWSLSYEFWYYAMFPLILVGLLPNRSALSRVVCLVLVVSAAVMVGGPILALFPIWLMGSALAVMKPLGERAGRWALYGGLLLLAGALVAVETQRQMPILLGDYLVGVSYGVLMIGVLARPADVPAPGYAAGAAGLAHMSYTLYLVHLPMLVFLNGWIIGTNDRWQPTPVACLGLAGICLAVFLAAKGVAAVTELRTTPCRSWLKRRWSGRRAAA